MGTPNAAYGEKGFCRIIGAANDNCKESVDEAINLEASSIETYLKMSEPTATHAVKRITTEIEEYLRISADEKKPLKTEKKPGRNDPCSCGSEKKFKKCCGK
jgi:preprotein translocase subunit SecA